MKKSAVAIVASTLSLGIGIAGMTSASAANPTQEPTVVEQTNASPGMEVQVVNRSGVLLQYGDDHRPYRFAVEPGTHRWHISQGAECTLWFGKTRMHAGKEPHRVPEIRWNTRRVPMAEGERQFFMVDGKWDIWVTRLCDTDKIRFKYDVQKRS